MATRVCRVVSLICIRGHRLHPLLTWFIVSAFVIVNLLSLPQCTFDSFLLTFRGLARVGPFSLFASENPAWSSWRLH